MCVYHYIQCIDLSSDSIFRLFSQDFQTDTDDFKVFFRSRQVDLEACCVELKNGDIYFWSRYSNWEYIGKAACYGKINMTKTKALLASTIPDECVHLDLNVADEYLMTNWEAVSITYNKK